MQTPSTTLPAVTPGSALFLDFDGTLAELAPQPDAVHIPGGLVPTLAALHDALGGAVAIVTGRRIADIDIFLAPLQLPIAGEHGAMFRLGDGERPGIEPPDLDQLAATVAELVAQHPGLLMERKSAAIALHYRQAPDLQELCRSTMEAAVARAPGVELLAGKCVYEAKPAGVNKGRAIAGFMSLEPFAGRTPLFAGDDATDESGFRAVRQLGGTGIKVGEGPTEAAHRCLNPAALRGWLATARSALTSAAPAADRSLA